MLDTLPMLELEKPRKSVTIVDPEVEHLPHIDEPESDDPFAYRHYQAFHPTANKLLSKQWEERTRFLHLKKLKEVKPTIDNAPPKIYPHLEMRLKKLKLEEDRLVDIKRKNQILLDRIAFQMVKFSEIGKKEVATKRDQKDVTKSIYSEKRRRDNAIIAIQNEGIVQRLGGKLPFYNRFEWLADRRRNLGYLRNISQYPKAYCHLIDEFDGNDHLVKLTKLATRPGSRAQKASPHPKEPVKKAEKPLKSAMKK